MKYTKDYLENNMNIAEVKQLILSLGIQPSNNKKDKLIQIILDYQETGKLPEKSTRGRPPKKGNNVNIFDDVFVSGPVEDDEDLSPQVIAVKGTFLKINEEYGFLRGDNLRPSPESDVYVSKPVIREYKLKQGDYVEGVAIVKREQSAPSLKSVEKLNGVCYTENERKAFEQLTPDYPREKFNLTGDLSVIDLFSPIGKGQRALIVAEPKAGKTTILKKIAENLSKEEGVKVIMLLVDERPEEVTDLKRCLNCEILSSTFDEEAERHVKLAEIALEKAKRIAESGEHAVILADSLTRITRAYNEISISNGKTMTGGIDYQALLSAKKFFGSARNLVEGGSLTIVATCLVNTGSKMDQVIYEEFKGTGNCDIVLTRSLCERRIFPPVDVISSGTRMEEFLLDDKTLSAVYAIRKGVNQSNMVNILEVAKGVKTSSELLNKLK